MGCFLKEKNEGMNVILIEKEKPPYVRHMGGFLNRLTFEKFPLLKPFQEKLVDTEIKQLRFISSDFKKEQIYSEENNILGYLVHRTTFDNTLLEIAKGHKLEFLMGEEAMKISAGMDGAKIQISKKKKIEAEALVGEDGIHSSLALQMGVYEILSQLSLYHGY
jgi:flavin-dependent dehydrogenase